MDMTALFAEFLQWFFSAPAVMSLVAVTFGVAGGLVALLHLTK